MILIEHAVVVTLDDERRIFTDGAVLVDGRDIVQVGRAADVRPPRPPERVIDGENRLVLPGFVNTHVHLSEHINRGVMADEIPVDRYMADWLLPLYSAITPEEEACSALLACLAFFVPALLWLLAWPVMVIPTYLVVEFRDELMLRYPAMGDPIYWA